MLGTPAEIRGARVALFRKPPRPGTEDCKGIRLDFQPREWLRWDIKAGVGRRIEAVLPYLVQQVGRITSSVLKEAVAVSVRVVLYPGQRLLHVRPQLARERVTRVRPDEGVVGEDEEKVSSKPP